MQNNGIYRTRFRFWRVPKIDDISSGFNGSDTQFNIQIGGQTAEIASLNQLIISISGVIQEPNSAFTFGSTRSTIAFTGPPAKHRYILWYLARE